jgi:hypothetical protein
MNALTRSSILTCALLTMFGCGRDQADEYAATRPATDTAAADPSAIRAEMWLDDFQVGSTAEGAETITETKDDFAPGELVAVSMAVEDAPQGATVMTYWYGPNDQALGYEMKEVTGQEQRLSFTQENTRDWQPGQYRAEIWVGDEKVNEQEFEVTAG